MNARVFGAAVCGSDHEREQSPCADAWQYALLAEGSVALCVCDGAGSVGHGAIGAHSVARAVVAALQALAPTSAETCHEALRLACERGREALLVEATRRELPPGELACTLVAVFAWQNCTAIAHVGDGAVVGRLRKTKELRVLSQPDRGEFANETWFISSPSWSDHLRLGYHEDIEVVCALTDGCERAAMSLDQTPFAPFWSPLFDFAGEERDAAEACAEVARLLAGESLRRSSVDDKTLAIAFLGS